MSAKDCGKHGNNKRRKLYWWLFGVITVIVFILALTILVIFLVLRPTHPRFNLQDATILQFNATAATALTTTMQVSLEARNPNRRIGVYYDRLDAFATYRNQQITIATRLPSSYQGSKGVSAWSPYLIGVAVPVSPFLVQAVQQDEAFGYSVINVNVDGSVRWKVGTWVSGHYHLDVNCPAYIRLNGGPSSDNALVRFQFPVSCSVEV